MDMSDRGPDRSEFPSDLEEATAEFGLQFPQCPQPAMLQAAHSGVLPEEARDRVNEHVSHCAACAALTSDLFALDETPIQARVQEEIWGRIRTGIAAEDLNLQATAPHGNWWRNLFRPMPLAMVTATSVVLLAIGVWFAKAPQPSAVQSQASLPKTAPPSVPSVLGLSKPAVMLPASALLVWRGATDAANTAGQELREALVPYEADRYPEAADRLEGLVKKYPGLAEAHFYLGICRLFTDRDADAATSLKAAQSLARPPLDGDAAWYLALAYHRSGRDGDARPLLEKLCTAATRNSARACAGRQELSVIQ